VYRLRVSVVAELNVGCRSKSKWRDARYLLIRLVQLPSASCNLHVDSTTFIQVPSFATSVMGLGGVPFLFPRTRVGWEIEIEGNRRKSGYKAGKTLE